MTGRILLFYSAFIFSVFVSSVSQIMLKKSADKQQTGLKQYLNVTVIGAYGLFFISTVLTVFAYKFVPLSAGPVLESAGYIFVSVMSYIFLKERLKKRQIVGIALILLGILIFSLGKYISWS